MTLISDEAEPTSISVSKLPELIELSENFITERLSVEIATDLVMDSMVYITINILNYIHVKFKLYIYILPYL